MTYYFRKKLLSVFSLINFYITENFTNHTILLKNISMNRLSVIKREICNFSGFEKKMFLNLLASEVMQVMEGSGSELFKGNA